MHMAARAGNVTAMRFILENCEDTSILSLRTIGGDTPLMCAAEQGSIDNIEMLIQVGSDALLKNYQGKTADQLAANDEVRVHLTLFYLGLRR